MKQVLFVSDLWLGSTALQRLNALKEIHQCDSIDSSVRLKKNITKYFQLFLMKMRWHFDFKGLNRKIVEAVGRKKYDFIWIEKGIRVYPATIRWIKEQQPQSKLIAFSPDDMYNHLNQSFWYLKSVGLYDLHVTTKSYNVNELASLGANDVIFVNKTYDPLTHRRQSLTEDEKKEFGCDVGFIGSWEADRCNHILFLAQSGIKVVVWGEAWKKYTGLHPNLIIKPKSQWADDYAKVLNATKINLCFLKKLNRDQQTARSIEIPACGGFMLAERTKEHQELFREDTEAVFFETSEELLEKVKYYLEHEDERARIAQNGYQRCLASGYDNKSMVKKVFQYLEQKKYAESPAV